MKLLECKALFVGNGKKLLVRSSGDVARMAPTQFDELEFMEVTGNEPEAE